MIHASFGISSCRAGIKHGLADSSSDPRRINHHRWSNYLGACPINRDVPRNYRRTPASYRYRWAINADGFSSVISAKAENTADLSAVSCRNRVNTADKSAAFFPDFIDTDGKSAVICAWRTDTDGKSSVIYRRRITTDGKSAVSGFVLLPRHWAWSAPLQILLVLAGWCVAANSFPPRGQFSTSLLSLSRFFHAFFPSALLQVRNTFQKADIFDDLKGKYGGLGIIGF